ncbi:MAG: glycosyltransferase family 2 protein, partial [Pseudomonadota bacterium]
SGNEDQRRTRFKRYKTNQMGKLLPRQAHSGGFGHILHIPTLKAVGGFVSTRWPFVLEDHEIIHRMLKRGRTAYDPKLWCRPSDRRNDRSSVEWTRLEQLGYHLCPFDQKDWYFYHFLANRFAKRGLYSDALRRKTWEKQKNSDAD